MELLKKVPNSSDYAYFPKNHIKQEQSRIISATTLRVTNYSNNQWYGWLSEEKKIVLCDLKRNFQKIWIWKWLARYIKRKQDFKETLIWTFAHIPLC